MATISEFNCPDLFERIWPSDSASVPLFEFCKQLDLIRLKNALKASLVLCTVVSSLKTTQMLFSQPGKSKSRRLIKREVWWFAT